MYTVCLILHQLLCVTHTARVATGQYICIMHGYIVCKPSTKAYVPSLKKQNSMV